MKTKNLIYVSMFAAITVILAWIPPIPLPFSPVPITLQVLGVMLAGAILGPKLGALAIIVYVAIGVLGVPVFAGGRAGFSVLAGPTGGYIIGFILAAYIIGLILARFPKRKNRHYALAMAAGLMAIYIPGTLQLAWITGMSPTNAFVVGSLPYIPLDLAKGIIATIVAKAVHVRIIGVINK